VENDSGELTAIVKEW